MPLMREKDLTETFQNAFGRLPAVSSVEVQRRNGDYTVDITVTDFARSVRDPIYRRQRELIKQYSGASFHFHVLDESPKTAEHAAIAE